MMMNVAVLMTCFNRKEKTLICLKSLFLAFESNKEDFILSIYLTDDGCSDGTSDAIRNEFSDKNITILKGTGSLYWAGGMRCAWKEALKWDYDGYLLLNDDTFVLNNVFSDILNANTYCLKSFGTEGIYIGSTSCVNDENLITYGGSIILNRWKQNTKRLIPNGSKPQECELGNANIMFVSRYAIQKLGILSSTYSHGIADYDYTIKANKKGVRVLVTSNVCGLCENDHPINLVSFGNKTLINRIKYAYSPLGFAFYDYIKYNSRNFIYRVPFVFLVGWLRIISPRIYTIVYKDAYKS